MNVLPCWGGGGIPNKVYLGGIRWHGPFFFLSIPQLPCNSWNIICSTTTKIFPKTLTFIHSFISDCNFSGFFELECFYQKAWANLKYIEFCASWVLRGMRTWDVVALLFCSRTTFIDMGISKLTAFVSLCLIFEGITDEWKSKLLDFDHFWWSKRLASVHPPLLPPIVWKVNENNITKTLDYK